MSEDLIRRSDAIKAVEAEEYLGYVECQADWLYDRINAIPTIEPNLALPERMERGDIYEVGETIVVMNHDDYYDLLCKGWVPKQGEWIYTDNPLRLDDEWACSRCGNISFARTNFCDRCGSRMKGADDE